MSRWDGKEAMREARGCGFEFLWLHMCIYSGFHCRFFLQCNLYMNYTCEKNQTIHLVPAAVAGTSAVFSCSVSKNEKLYMNYTCEKIKLPSKIRIRTTCTNTKTLICPGWETPIVPVSQPWTPVRDKRGAFLSRVWQPGQKRIFCPGW